MGTVQPNSLLKDKLYQVNFHTTMSGESMVTLIYHKKLDAAWIKAAAELRSILCKVPSCSRHNVQLLGRSRKQKVKLGNDHVDEVMTVFGKDYSYRQVEGAFSQPNGGQSILHIVPHCYFSCDSSVAEYTLRCPEVLLEMGVLTVESTWCSIALLTSCLCATCAAMWLSALHGNSATVHSIGMSDPCGICVNC